MNKKARIKQIEDDILKCIIPLSPEAVVQVRKIVKNIGWKCICYQPVNLHSQPGSLF